MPNNIDTLHPRLPNVLEVLEDDSLRHDLERLVRVVRIGMATKNSLHNVERRIDELEAALVIAREQFARADEDAKTRGVSFFKRASDPAYAVAGAALSSLEEERDMLGSARLHMVTPDLRGHDD